MTDWGQLAVRPSVYMSQFRVPYFTPEDVPAAPIGPEVLPLAPATNFRPNRFRGLYLGEYVWPFTRTRLLSPGAIGPFVSRVQRMLKDAEFSVGQDANHEVHPLNDVTKWERDTVLWAEKDLRSDPAHTTGWAFTAKPVFWSDLVLLEFRSVPEGGRLLLSAGRMASRNGSQKGRPDREMLDLYGTPEMDDLAARTLASGSDPAVPIRV